MTWSHSRSVILYALLFVLLASSTIYMFFSEQNVTTVDLSELRIEVVTDKTVYLLNETIEATVYLCNDKLFPVRIRPILQYYITGYSAADPEKISAIVNVTPVKDWVVIPANSIDRSVNVRSASPRG